MPNPTSRLTTKYQATIPEPVRNLLCLEAGDTLAFDIQNDEVRLRKATPIDVEFARAVAGTLDEWASDADEEAWRDL